MKYIVLSFSLIAVLLSCQRAQDVVVDSDTDSDPEGITDGDGDGDSDGDTDGDNDTDTDADNDSDADGDNDSDVDGDNDSDIDSDADGDGDPGGQDQECNTVEPFCEAGLLPVNVDNGEGEVECYCLGQCTIFLCTVTDIFGFEVTGYCNDPYTVAGPYVGEVGNCINEIDFPDPFEALYECTPEETGCTTNSGTTENTTCMELSIGTVCLEDCELPDPCNAGTLSCDICHQCIPLFDGSSGTYTGQGVCLGDL